MWLFALFVVLFNRVFVLFLLFVCVFVCKGLDCSFCSFCFFCLIVCSFALGYLLVCLIVCFSIIIGLLARGRVCLRLLGAHAAARTTVVYGWLYECTAVRRGVLRPDEARGGSRRAGRR